MAKPALRRTRPAPTGLGAQPGGPAVPTGHVYRDLADRGQLRTVPITSITPNARQPRRTFDPGTLTGLAESIEQLGVLQPPLVRPLGDGRYELIAGERRWRAATQAGLKELDVIVRAHPAGALAALAENLQREDLDPVDEARAYRQALTDLDIGVQTLAEHLGKSRPEISNSIRLLELPENTLALLQHRKLTKAHGRALLAEPDPGRRDALATQAAAEQWSVRQLEAARDAAPAPPPSSPAPPTGPGSRWIEEQSSRLGEALGHPAKVAAGRRGYRVALSFRTAEELEQFLTSPPTGQTP